MGVNVINIALLWIKECIYTNVVEKVLPDRFELYNYENSLVFSRGNNNNVEMEKQKRYWQKLTSTWKKNTPGG